MFTRFNCYLSTILLFCFLNFRDFSKRCPIAGANDLGEGGLPNSTGVPDTILFGHDNTVVNKLKILKVFRIFTKIIVGISTVSMAIILVNLLPICKIVRDKVTKTGANSIIKSVATSIVKHTEKDIFGFIIYVSVCILFITLSILRFCVLFVTDDKKDIFVPIHKLVTYISCWIGGTNVPESTHRVEQVTGITPE